MIGFRYRISSCVDYDVLLMLLQIRENSFDLKTLLTSRLSNFIKVHFFDGVKIDSG